MQTGLDYFNARYYDPSTGRFISQDPIGFAGGDANLYRYVGNNPVNFTDPSGLSPDASLKTDLPAVSIPSQSSSSVQADLSPEFTNAVERVVNGLINKIGRWFSKKFGGGSKSSSPAPSASSSGSGGSPGGAGNAANQVLSENSLSLAGPPPSATMLGGGPISQSRTWSFMGAQVRLPGPELQGSPDLSPMEPYQLGPYDPYALKPGTFTPSRGLFASPAFQYMGAMAEPIAKPASEFGLAAGEIAAGIFVPGVGELQDLAVLHDPNAPGWQKGFSGFTLAYSAWTFGEGPNAGSFFRAADHAPSSFRGLANEGVAGNAIDASRFSQMKAAFQRSGGVIDQSTDTQAYLLKRQAGGLTFDAKTVLLPQNPTTTAVFEEFIHTAQHRTGRFSNAIEQFGNAEAIRRMEIEAAEKLIRNRNAWQIPNAETRQTIDRLRDLRNQ